MHWMELTQTTGALSGLVCLVMAIISLKKQLKTSICRNDF